MHRSEKEGAFQTHFMRPLLLHRQKKEITTKKSKSISSVNIDVKLFNKMKFCCTSKMKFDCTSERSFAIIKLILSQKFKYGSIYTPAHIICSIIRTNGKSIWLLQ